MFLLAALIGGLFLTAPVQLQPVEVAQPACCLEVKQLPAQPELRVVNNYGMQP